MKRITVLAIIATLPLLAQAADQKQLHVTATIVDSCVFREVPTLAFGSIDPVGTTSVRAAATVRYTCTKGAPASLTVGANATGSISRELKRANASNEVIAYNISWTPPTGFGNGHGVGNEIALTLNALINEADYQNASGGDYADDTLYINITP